MLRFQIKSSLNSADHVIAIHNKSSLHACGIQISRIVHDGRQTFSHSSSLRIPQGIHSPSSHLDESEPPWNEETQASIAYRFDRTTEVLLSCQTQKCAR